MDPPNDRVSTIELFFDLVFVFTITQLTSLLADDPTAIGVIRMSPIAQLSTLVGIVAGGVVTERLTRAPRRSRQTCA